MKIEIQQELALTGRQSALLEMHSFLNVMNVLQGEFHTLGKHTESEGALRTNLASCQHIIATLQDQSQALAEAGALAEYERAMLARVEDLVRRTLQQEEAQRTVKNIRSVFNVLKVRARELLARVGAVGAWEVHDTVEMEADFGQVFQAIELNSKDRYRILSNVAAHGPNDYLVHLALAGSKDRQILMPPVVKDVLRDLLANARKYTPPGGAIHGGLLDDGWTLRLVVADTGVGIPEEEIEHVVDFGYRASNVREKTTMGSGFGLTKAYAVARRFDGRMWIDSEVGRGTRIEIAIPSRSKGHRAWA